MWIFILPFPLTAFAGWPKGIYIPMSHASSSHEWSWNAFITETEMPCYESRSLNPYLLTQRGSSRMRHWDYPQLHRPSYYMNVIVTNPIFVAYSEDDVTFSSSKAAWSLRGKYIDITWPSSSKWFPWHRSAYANSMLASPWLNIQLEIFKYSTVVHCGFNPHS